MQDIFVKIWEFIRGDLPSSDFEKLLYENKDNACIDYLGEELYLKCIENPYSDKNLTYLLKEELKKFQRENHPTKCKCVEMKSPLHVVCMGRDDDNTLDTYNEIATHGQPYWWLQMSQCRICGKYLLIAQEERQNDLFCTLVLDPEVASDIINHNIWPDDFNKYETLLEIGYTAGIQMKHCEPLESETVRNLIEDIAHEHPNISLSRLSVLLNLDMEILEIIIGEIASERKVAVDLNN